MFRVTSCAMLCLTLQHFLPVEQCAFLQHHHIYHYSSAYLVNNQNHSNTHSQEYIYRHSTAYLMDNLSRCNNHPDQHISHQDNISALIDSCQNRNRAHLVLSMSRHYNMCHLENNSSDPYNKSKMGTRTNATTLTGCSTLTVGTAFLTGRANVKTTTSI